MMERLDVAIASVVAGKPNVATAQGAAIAEGSQ
jgi:hypothetical protein